MRKDRSTMEHREKTAARELAMSDERERERTSATLIKLLVGDGRENRET